MNIRATLQGVFVAAAALVYSACALAHDDDDDKRYKHSPPTRTVVLVHGAFADGSCWGDVIRILQDAGVKVVSTQNPLTSLAADVDAANRVINQQSQPVVLVGHSWVGFVITHAGMNPKVDSLVYIAAFSPDVGMSVASMSAPYPPAPWGGDLVPDENFNLILSEKAFVKFFVPDLPIKQAKALWATQTPAAQGTLIADATQTAWRYKPSWYLLAKRDQIINPDLQRVMSARMNARTRTIDGGHVPMLYSPGKVADVILDAVRGKDR